MWMSRESWGADAGSLGHTVSVRQATTSDLGAWFYREGQWKCLRAWAGEAVAKHHGMQRK